MHFIILFFFFQLEFIRLPDDDFYFFIEKLIEAVMNDINKNCNDNPSKNQENKNIHGKYDKNQKKFIKKFFFCDRQKIWKKYFFDFLFIQISTFNLLVGILFFEYCN